MKNLYLTVSLFFLIIQVQVQAQRIRKDHREMTPAEKTAYVDALNQLWEDGVLYNPNDLDDMGTVAGIHHMHGSMWMPEDMRIHGGPQFLSWHRLFVMDMEERLRSVDSNLTIPYWDWPIENTVSNISWNANGFLSQALISSWGLSSRSSMGGVLDAGYPTEFTISGLMATNDFTNFRQNLETGYHNNAHGFVGGIMGSFSSPADPVFFLHHGNVDRIWQEWEDLENPIKSDFMATMVPEWESINPNSIIDSRNTMYQDMDGNMRTEDVWYAKNGKLVLDGLRGNFTTGSNNKTYCYVAWNGTSVEGEIFAGDLRRYGNDIVADDKGGFIVSTGANCEFNAGKAIVLSPGFEVVNGSIFSASIVNSACGFDNNSARISNQTDTAILYPEKLVQDKTIKMYPNPNNGIFRISLNGITEGTIQITNMVGLTVFKTDFKNQNEFEINIENQPKGLYIVKINSENKLYTNKIIKN